MQLIKSFGWSTFYPLAIKPVDKINLAFEQLVPGLGTTVPKKIHLQ